MHEWVHCHPHPETLFVLIVHATESTLIAQLTYYFFTNGWDWWSWTWVELTFTVDIGYMVHVWPVKN